MKQPTARRPGILSAKLTAWARRFSLRRQQDGNEEVVPPPPQRRQQLLCPFGPDSAASASMPVSTSSQSWQFGNWDLNSDCDSDGRPAPAGRPAESAHNQTLAVRLCVETVQW